MANIFGFPVGGGSSSAFGSPDDDSDLVTLDTDQIIFGVKTLDAPLFFSYTNSLNQTTSSCIQQSPRILSFSGTTINSSFYFNAQDSVGASHTPLKIDYNNVRTFSNVIFGLDPTGGSTSVNTNQIMPAATDSSTIVPSSAWVQSAIILSVPSGVMSLFAGSAAPAGYLLCDGSIYLIASYSALYAAIGNAFNPGHTTLPSYFYIPDMRGIYAGMPGLNNSAVVQAGGLESAVLNGPAGIGYFQHQSLPTVPHNHATDYPDSTNTADYNGTGIVHSFYQSGSSAANHNSGAIQNVVAPNTFTDVNNYIKPVSLGLNYIIKI
jgi:microcystin-dependent protein